MVFMWSSHDQHLETLMLRCWWSMWQNIKLKTELVLLLLLLLLLSVTFMVNPGDSETGGLEISGQRLISLNSKTKRIVFSSSKRDFLFYNHAHNAKPTHPTICFCFVYILVESVNKKLFMWHSHLSFIYIFCFVQWQLLRGLTIYDLEGWSAHMWLCLGFDSWQWPLKLNFSIILVSPKNAFLHFYFLQITA